MNFSFRNQLLLIIFLFLLTRSWPLMTFEPWSDWQVYQARKLDQYGLLERKGALLDIHFMNGVVPNPEKFNYPNHPAPIHWLNTLFYRGFGDWGVVLLATALGFFGTIAALFALNRFFTPKVALAGAILFVLAPTSIIYDVDPNQGALGAIIWPLAVSSFAIGGSFLSPLILGLACLLTGQMSWVVWLVFPSLLVLALGLAKERNWHARVSKKMVVALFTGAGLTIAFFLMQVLFYTPDWDKLLQYVGKQSVQEIGIKEWLVRIVTRSGMSLGPALLLGASAGTAILARKSKLSALELAALIFIPIFLLGSVVLRGFFFRENWPYEYAVFPAVILTCSALSNISSQKIQRYALVLLFGLCLPSMAYVYLRFSNPILSPQTEFIAQLMAENSQPHEVVATNLEDQLPPLPFWNVSGLGIASQKADRLIRSNIKSKEELFNLLINFQADSLDVVFINSLSRPIDSKLQNTLENLSSISFELPQSFARLPLSLRLREQFWKLAGRHQVEKTNCNLQATENIFVYRLKVSRDKDAM